MLIILVCMKEEGTSYAPGPGLSMSSFETFDKEGRTARLFETILWDPLLFLSISRVLYYDLEPSGL
jgi:hypothetical protein